MRTNAKGRVGYLKKEQIRYGMLLFLGFLVIALLYGMGYLLNGSNKNAFTILAVLLVLPTAKVAVLFFMVSSNGKVTIEEYQKLEALAPLPVFYELMITVSQKNYVIPYLVISKDYQIVAYTRKKHQDQMGFQKGLTNFLNLYEIQCQVVLMDDSIEFLRICKALNQENSDWTKEEREAVNGVFQKLSNACI